jgi:hypothetical protein
MKNFHNTKVATQQWKTCAGQKVGLDLFLLQVGHESGPEFSSLALRVFDRSGHLAQKVTSSFSQQQAPILPSHDRSFHASTPARVHFMSLLSPIAIRLFWILAQDNFGCLACKNQQARRVYETQMM